MNTVKYWLRLVRLFFHYQKKSFRLPYFPVRMWVELTSDCNFQCIMCPNKDLKDSDRGFMDIGLFRKIVDEAAGSVFEINLAHRGESLLHPNIIDAITYTKGKKIFTRLHTNGSLLTEDLSRKIVASGLDRLSFSFDGYEKTTYEKIRRGGDFEKTAGNIIRFLEIKKEAGSKTPETAIEVINFGKDDKSAKEAFRNRFKDLPLDSFVMKELHNWAGELKQKESSAKYSVCPFPWNAAIICWDGSMVPCTQDFFNHYIPGNVNEAPIRDIWNNDNMVTLRKKLASGDIKDLKACSECDRPWRKRIMGIPKEYLWKFITKRIQ